MVASSLTAENLQLISRPLVRLNFGLAGHASPNAATILPAQTSASNRGRAGAVAIVAPRRGRQNLGDRAGAVSPLLPIRSAIISCIQKHESKPRPPCPMCGGTEFIDGQSFGMAPVGFVSGPASIWKSFATPEPVRASKCKACGYLLQFDQPDPRPGSAES